MHNPSPFNHHQPGDSDQNLSQWDNWQDSSPTILQLDDGLFLSAPTAGHSSGSTSSGTSSTTGTTSTTSSSSTGGLVINISWDASVSSAPTGFTTAVMNAVQYLESQFSNPVTINIDVGYGECNGYALGSGALGESYSWLNSFSYSTLANALKTHASTAAAQSAVATTPASLASRPWVESRCGAVAVG